MGRRRIRAAAIAVLTGTTGLTIGTAVPASADSSQHPLAITSVGDIVVDGAHEQIFISDPDGDKVIATDYSGNQVGAAQVSDANSLALAADASQVYVTSVGESAIFALDTAALTQTAKYSTGGVAPYDVTAAGGRIWFSYFGDREGRLGTIDPSTETPAPSLDRYRTGMHTAHLATALAKPNRIGVVSESMTAVLDVSGDIVTEVASLQSLSSVDDMAISPDGDRIATVSTQGAGIRLREISDLKAERVLPYRTFPNAVDFASDGSVVGGSTVPVAPVVHVFAPSGELVKEIEPANHGVGRDRGVAWEPNGDRLFGVSSNGTNFVFNAYTDTRRSPTTMTLAAPEAAVPRAPITVTGRLTSSLSLAAGTTVAATRNGTSLGAVAVGSGGSFSFTDTPPADGTATYQVSYAGDGTHLPSAATESVQVARATSTVTLFGPSTVLPGAPVAIEGRLTSPFLSHAGHSVSVSRSGVPLGTATVDANEDFSFTDTPPGEGTWAYSFSYAGDDLRTPATSTKSVVVSRMASTLTLAGPSSATRAKPLTITGTLASPLGLAAGTRVSMTRADLDHPSGTALGSRTVGPDGSFAFSDTPAAGGPVTYRASYAGDLTRAPTTTTKAVAVSRTTAALTLTNNGKVYDYGKTVSFTARLGSVHKNRTVEIWADPAGDDQPKRLLKKGAVDSAGKLSVSLRLTRNTALTVNYTGDAVYAPRVVSARVSTRVAVNTAVANYFKIKKIGSQKYYVVRTTKDPYFNTMMTPYPGRYHRLVLQRYSGGTWKSFQSALLELDTNGRSAASITGEYPAGSRFRVRAEYGVTANSDKVNATTYGAWKYYTYAE